MGGRPLLQLPQALGGKEKQRTPWTKSLNPWPTAVLRCMKKGLGRIISFSPEMIGVLNPEISSTLAGPSTSLRLANPTGSCHSPLVNTQQGKTSSSPMHGAHTFQTGDPGSSPGNASSHKYTLSIARCGPNLLPPKRGKATIATFRPAASSEFPLVTEDFLYIMRRPSSVGF